MELDVATLNRDVERETLTLKRIESELRRVIVGQDYLLDRLLVGLLARGHVLIEGVPGLAKTLAVKTLAQTLAIARGLRSPVLAGTPLARGEAADFLLLRSSDPELSAGDPDADLVYAAGGAVVDTTVVAGEVLMRDREVAGAQEAVSEVRERAARLTA